MHCLKKQTAPRYQGSLIPYRWRPLLCALVTLAMMTVPCMGTDSGLLLRHDAAGSMPAPVQSGRDFSVSPLVQVPGVSGHVSQDSAGSDQIPEEGSPLANIQLAGDPILIESVPSPVIAWGKSLGGSGTDEARSISGTPTGGYIVAGWTRDSDDGDVSGNHGNRDFWVVNLTASGSITWQKCLGGSMGDEANEVAPIPGGGYIVAGHTYSSDGQVTGNQGAGDFWVVNLTATGDIEWQKNLGGSDLDMAYSVSPTSYGGFIVAGQTQSTNGDVSGYHGGLIDIWVVNLTANGDIEWQKCLGGNGADRASRVLQTTDGGYIVAGYSKSTDIPENHGSSYDDIYLAKLDRSGAVTWQKCLGGTLVDQAYDIRETADGGYIVAGLTTSSWTGYHGNGNYDFLVVKLDSAGNREWDHCYGGSLNDAARSIRQLDDGGYIVAGYTYSVDGDVSGHHEGFGNDYWVIRLGSGGDLVWQKCLGGTDNDEAYSVIRTGNAFVTAGKAASSDGNVSGNHGLEDFWVVKLDDSTLVTSVTPSSAYNSGPVPLTIRGSLFQPGPVVNLTNGVQNLTGTITSFSTSQIRATFPITGASPGLYNLTVFNTDGTNATKENAFTVRAAGPRPVLTKITPASGYNAVNSPVTVSGSYFRTGASVYLYQGMTSRKATVTQCLSNQIKCTLPTRGLGAGVWTVKVSNTDGTAGTKAFTIQKAGPVPRITKITPVKGLVSANTQVTITGRNFRVGATVQMKKGAKIRKATGVKILSGKITCTLPTRGAPAGLWSLMITNRDGTTVTKVNAFSVVKKLADAPERQEPLSGAVFSPVVGAPASGSGPLLTPRAPGIVPVIIPVREDSGI